MHGEQRKPVAVARPSVRFLPYLSYADWIGRGGRPSYPGGQIQGDIRSTTVYKGKWDWSVEVSEGVVVYGADGISKEQVQ